MGSHVTFLPSEGAAAMLWGRRQEKACSLWPGSVLPLCSGSQELWARGRWDEWAPGQPVLPRVWGRWKTQLMLVLFWVITSLLLPCACQLAQRKTPGLLARCTSVFIFIQPSQKVKLLQESRLGILWDVLVILLKDAKYHLLCYWAS